MQDIGINKGTEREFQPILYTIRQRNVHVFIDRFKFYKEISCDIIDSHHFLNAAISYGHVTVLRQL